MKKKDKELWNNGDNRFKYLKGDVSFSLSIYALPSFIFSFPTQKTIQDRFAKLNS